MADKYEQGWQRLGFLLTQVSLLKQRLINSALRAIDITFVQFIILAATTDLGEGGKTVTQQDIATERLLDKAMVSTVVQTLVKKGLMQRERHPADHRSYILSLTTAGIKKTERGKEIALKVENDFFRDTDKKALQKTLLTLLGNAQRTDE